MVNVFNDVSFYYSRRLCYDKIEIGKVSILNFYLRVGVVICILYKKTE